MKNKKITILALLNLGIVSLLVQVILIRELITSFYGNELFIGLVLAFWLISTGLGSLWLGRKIKGEEKVIFGLQILVTIFLLNALVLSRLARSILSEGGVMPDLIYASLWTILVIMPTGLLLGMIFVTLIKLIKDKNDRAVTHGYIIESLGFFMGALLFNFILFQFTGLTIIFIIAILNFIIALLFSFKFSLSKPILVAILIIFLAISLSQTSLIDKKLFEKQYLKEKILIAKNSKYGSIHLTQTGEQINFYYNGHILDNTQNRYHNELMTHLPMLLNDNPETVLVIGNAFTGIINEINKYNPKAIIYLELDKDYYELAKQTLEFNEPDNLKVIHQDARNYFKLSTLKFDVIIINYSNPSTLSENRYFTQEFFTLIKSHLNNQGIVVLKINTTPNYTFGAQNKLLASLYQTLEQTMQEIIVLPENEIIYLASQDKINYNRDLIIQKYQDLNLKNQYLFPEYINWRFTNDRTEMLNKQLSETQAQINSDFKPTLYYQQLKIFLEKMQINKWKILFSIIIFILIILSLKIVLKLKIGNWKLLFISALPEFCLISFEILLILLFQTFHGYLYTQLSLIIALVLVGIAVGSMLFKKLLENKNALQLLKLSYLLIIFTFAIPLIITWQFQFIYNFKLFYYLISLLAGFAIGTKFPVINRLYLKSSSNLGAIYGVDLIGGAVGALLAGIFMLPVLGVIGSLVLIVGLCLFGFIIFLET